MLPFPIELRINLTIVASYLSKIQDQPSKAKKTKDHNEGDWIFHASRSVGTFENGADTRKGPKAGEEDSEPPKKKRPGISSRTGWRRRLCRMGLANAPMQNAGIGARSQLIDEWDGHNICGSALIALIRNPLQYSCHLVVPEPGDISSRQVLKA